jgi:hypothetical protein
MSIPLERLYDYIQQTCNNIAGHKVIVSRFWPHGSKNLEDFSMYVDYSLIEQTLNSNLLCWDQEPLDFYSCARVDYSNTRPFPLFLKSLGIHVQEIKFWHRQINVYKKVMLLHSEKNSLHVDLFRNNDVIPVYYWSHAIIARDWFRYAEFVELSKNASQTFLIYNRAWQGTREYRLKFCELLHEKNLVNQCKINLNCIEPESGVHYKKHIFHDNQWQPTIDLEPYFSPGQAGSASSADFDINDYASTEIEVVLETLFADQRWHLTEKILRPIACGHPFILASTPGSLSYLRSYGFRTFAEVWDESYDDIVDHGLRLRAIVNEMEKISQWSENEKQKKQVVIDSITEHNKKLFFSQQFLHNVIRELSDNFSTAFEELSDQIDCESWLVTRKNWADTPEILKFINEDNLGKPWPDWQTFLTVQQLVKNYHKNMST